MTTTAMTITAMAILRGDGDGTKKTLEGAKKTLEQI